MSTGSTTNLRSPCSSLLPPSPPQTKSLANQSSVWLVTVSLPTCFKHTAGHQGLILCPPTLDTKCLRTLESPHICLHTTVSTSRASTTILSSLTTSRGPRKKWSTTHITNEWASFSSYKQASFPSHGLISVDPTAQAGFNIVFLLLQFICTFYIFAV